MQTLQYARKCIFCNKDNPDCLVMTTVVVTACVDTPGVD